MASESKFQNNVICSIMIKHNDKEKYEYEQEYRAMCGIASVVVKCYVWHSVSCSKVLCVA